MCAVPLRGPLPVLSALIDCVQSHIAWMPGAKKNKSGMKQAEGGGGCHNLHTVISSAQWHWEKNIMANRQHNSQPTLEDDVHTDTHRVHQGGFRVGHQDKDISVQAELVNPAVQLGCDVGPRAEDTRE